MTTTNNIEDRYGFTLGGLYPNHAAANPDEYRDAALRAERYIAQHQVEDADGVHWTPTQGESIDLTQYSGAAGLAFFYRQLYTVTGQKQFDDIAFRGFQYVAKHWQEALDTQTMTFDTSSLPSYQWGGAAGIGGIGESLLFAFDTYADETFSNAAEAIGRFYEQHAKRDTNGAFWTGSIATSFDGGALLFLASLYKAFPEPWLLALIHDAGAWYLAQGHHTDDNGLRFTVIAEHNEFELPNFGYGSAGAGYVLLALYGVLQDKRFLDGARAAARYLDSIKVQQTKGYLIPYRFGLDEEPFYYLGNCHGPAGTSRFLYRLYDVTGEERYRTFITDLVDGFESLGAPERQSKGLWNSVCFCCGHAGIVHFFVGLYAADPQKRWKELAQRTAAVLLGYEEQRGDGSSDWPGAWTRTESDDISRRIGYYDGAAGIASVLLELYTLNKGSYRPSGLIEDPFPAWSQSDKTKD
jgi:lantibiotic modifying enzyme